MTTKRKHDPKQTHLPLSRDERLSALRAIRAEDLQVGRRSWSNVVDLLEQIEFCTMRDGCFAYAETLAARMNGKRGVSRPTFFRTSKLAKELGLLSAMQRTSSRGASQSNEWRVNWAKVMSLAHGTETPPCQTETPPSQTDTPPCQTETPLIRINPVVNPVFNPSRSSRSTVEDDQKENWSEADQAATRDVANRIVRALAPPRSDADRSLVAKVAWLAGRVYSEHWLWDAVEACRRTRPANWYAYWFTCLAEGAAREGKQLERELARVRVPREFLQRAAHQVDLSQRLCAIGREP